MPKQQQQYQGALDSIYNVIFAQAQKPPQKKKGGDWTKGIPGDPLSYAVTDMLAKPWMFWGNSITEFGKAITENASIKSLWTFGPGFTPVTKRGMRMGYVDKRRNRYGDKDQGVTAIRTSALLGKDFIKDLFSPALGTRYIQAVAEKAYEGYKKERRKWELSAILGGAYDALVGFGYAKKIGLKGDDALAFAAASGYFVSGAGQNNERMRLKAENISMSLSTVNSVSDASIYTPVITKALNRSGLWAYYAVDLGTAQLRENHYTTRLSEFRAELAKELRKAGIPVTPALLDDIQTKYAQEINVFGQTGTGRPRTVDNQEVDIIHDPFTPGAVRETIIRNRDLKYQLLGKELDDAVRIGDNAQINRIRREMEQTYLQREFADALQRIKGGLEDYNFDFSSSMANVEAIRSSVSDPRSVARLDSLLIDIGRERDALMKKTFGNAYREGRLTGGYLAGRKVDPNNIIGGWTTARVPFSSNLNQKHARKAFEYEVEARIIQLSDDIGRFSPGSSEYLKIEDKIRGLTTLVDRVRDLKGTAFRHRLGSMIVGYNYLKALTSSGTFTIGSFMNGTAFWQNGLLSPGIADSLKWWDSDKMINAEIGRFIMPRTDQALMKGLTNFYYMRPSSIINTLLVNGEGYFFHVYNNKKKMVKELIRLFRPGFSYGSNEMNAIVDLVNYGFSSKGKIIRFGLADIRDSYELEGFLGTNFHVILEVLAGGEDALPDVLKPSYRLILGIIGQDRLSSWSKKIAALDKIVQRTKLIPGVLLTNKITEFWGNSKFVNGILDASQAIFSKLSADPAWKNAVKSFFSGDKIGLNEIITVLLRKFLKLIKLGSAAGGPPGWLVFVVTQIVFLFSDKIVKVLIKAGTGLVRGIIAIGVLAIFMVIGCGGMLSMLFDPFSDVDPNEAVSASAVGGIDEWYIHQTFYSGEEGTYEKVFRGNEQAIPAYFDNYSCIVNSPTSCGQGTGGGGSYSHSKDGGYSAIDFTPENHTMLAPADGVVTYFSPTNRCLAEGAASDANYGGHIQFKTNEGDILVMYHAKLPPGVRVGDRVSMGDPLAISQSDINSVGNPCWTGEHIHLEIKAPNNFRYNCIESWVYSKCSNFSTCLYSECN